MVPPLTALVGLGRDSQYQNAVLKEQNMECDKHFHKLDQSQDIVTGNAYISS